MQKLKRREIIALAAVALAAGVLLWRSVYLAANNKDRLIAQARLYVKQNQPQRAVKILTKLTRRFPQDAALWLEQSKAALQAGQLDLARASIEAAKKLPLDSHQKHDIAMLHQDLKEFSPAMAMLEELIRQDSKNALFYKDRGLCRYLAEKSNADEAIKDLQKALRLEPRLLSASITLGSIYMDRKQYQQALAVSDSALKKEPLPDEQGLRPLLVAQREQILKQLSP